MKSRPQSSTRPPILLLCLALASLCVSAPRAVAQTAGEPRTEARQEAYQFAAAGEALSWDQSLRLALWASTESDTSAAYAAIASAVEPLAALTASMDTRAKAEAVLEYMHKRFLRAYSDRQTRVDVILSSGTYNCVSSAALYMILGTAVGLDVGGVMTKDHAFCSVRVGVDFIDVETTNPYGFDPGSKKEFHDSFGRATGFAYVPPRNYRDRTVIGRRELLSLILSNRSADLESAGRFREAVGVAVDRWALLGAVRGAPWDDLVARLLNYGASLANSGRERAALDWAAKAVSLFGDDRRWRDFSYSAANNLVVKLIRSGDLDKARAEFSAAVPLVDDRSRRELERLVTDAELTSAAETAAVSDEAAAAFSVRAAAARQAGIVPADRLRDIEVYAALKRTERVARESGWAAAAAEAERAIARVGPDRRLEDARNAYRSNRIAELHNAFARLFNAKRYAEARDAAAAAVSEFPGERRLKADLDTAERALASSSR